MVVFTCGYCGESIQKPKVEKHYLTKCRNKNPNLSCMDCFKDFLGNDYEAHTKCVTEEERYSGKGFMAKEKKGEKKQNAWVEMLQSVLDEQQGAPKNVLRIVEAISKHNNTPRKKPKFVNFVKNICGHKTNQTDIDQAWELISVKLAALSAVTQNGKPNNDIKLTNGIPLNGHNDHDSETIVNEKEIKKTEQDPENHTQNSETEDNSVLSKEETAENEKENVNIENKNKLTKKQRKQEKKRLKYEAELQSVAVSIEEVEEDESDLKKGKKKKNRTESNSGEVEDNAESKKQKKRKRQDTVNSVNGVQEAEETEAIKKHTENEIIVKEKTEKKKLKIDSAEIVEESVCLHDQNVATIEEGVEQSGGKFNWHAVIMSVLEKKGNEVPFKRLQKKVLSEYSEATGREVDDRIAEKFIKKLKSAPNVRVDKNRVLLVE